MGNELVRQFANVKGFKPSDAGTYSQGINNKSHLTKRSLILWEVSHIGSNQYIEMYVNPSNLRIDSKKEIQTIRTKGGYTTQYWGEALDKINIQGTTGSSGIEGMNVLRDVYRSEQLAMQNLVAGSNPNDVRRQSLMQLAASVTMHYQGQSYRGFFENLTYTEKSDSVGVLDYTIMFAVVEIKGKRKNFLSWHRHPWSTSETPNSGIDPATSNGGYNNNSKVGTMNAMPYTVETQMVKAEGNTFLGTPRYRFIEVVVLRGDPKDPSAKGRHTLKGSDSYKQTEFVNSQVKKSIRQEQSDSESAAKAAKQAVNKVTGQ